MGRITSETELRQVLGHPAPTTQLKIHRTVTERAARFISRSPMLFLATVDEAGRPTVSPKGDEAGFVKVEPDGTLLVPERKGNRLLMSYRNLLANDRVGLLFVVPGTAETLRVHGQASLLVDDELCGRLACRGRAALLVMTIRVEECFFHCGKAVIRSAVWRPETWPGPDPVSFGAEIAANLCPAEEKQWVADFDQMVQEKYRSDL